MSEYTKEPASLLNIAQRVHDEYVNEGETRAKELLADAQSTADSLVANAEATSEKLLNDATSEADRVVLEAEKEAQNIITLAREEEEELKVSINDLKRVEYEYRARLSDLANTALKTLESSQSETSPVESYGADSYDAHDDETIVNLQP